jgi:hypothetical protein
LVRASIALAVFIFKCTAVARPIALLPAISIPSPSPLLKHEVIAPPLYAWVENRDVDSRFGIQQRHSCELGAVAVATCQGEIVEGGAAAVGAWHQMLHLERAVEELLRGEAVLVLVIGATGDLLVLSRGHALQRGQR